jgi:hypothetical protein
VNNIISFNAASSIVNSQQDKLVGKPYGDADIEIVPSNLYTYVPEAGHRDFVRVPGLAWHERESGTFVAKTSEKYKATQYPESIDAVRRVLDRGEYDTTGIEETIRVSQNFGMMAATYKLPAVNFKSPDGDTACLNLGVITSFDGTWKFEMMAGSILSICMNSQVFLRNPLALYAQRHSSKLNIDTGVRQVGRAIDMMFDEAELWHELYNHPCSDSEADLIFIDSLEIKDRDYATADQVRTALAQYTTRIRGNSIRNKNLDYLRKVYREDYSRRMGRNRWAVYNALTDWRTHAPARTNANVIKLDINRGKIVADVVARNWGIAA